jgi:hypothetical protein
VESIDNYQEFQAIDMKGCLFWRPGARDFHIVHMGSPPLVRGICINGHIRVKKLERDPRCKIMRVPPRSKKLRQPGLIDQCRRGMSVEKTRLLK